MFEGVDGVTMWRVVAVTSLLLTLYLWAALRFRAMRIYDTTNSIRDALQDHPWFHEVYGVKSYGNDGSHKINHRLEFWADCTYSVIVKHLNKPALVIGFEIRKKHMHVYQLLGLRRAWLGGVDVGTLLIPYAEHVARLLHLERITIESAHRHMYFEPTNEKSKVYINMYAHQERLRAIYDRAPQSLGYDPVVQSGQFIGWAKRLRKRITFTRWLRLLELEFNRSARKSPEVLSELVQD